MTADPNTGLAEVGRAISLRRAVVGVLVTIGTHGILVASPLSALSGRDGGLGRYVDEVYGTPVRAAGSNAVADLDPDETAGATPSQWQRKTIHVDMDAFYASAAISHERPEYQDFHSCRGRLCHRLMMSLTVIGIYRANGVSSNLAAISDFNSAKQR